MVNHWLNKQQAQASGKPCLIPRQVEINGEWVWDGKWFGGPRPVTDILLTYTRCNQLGCPVRDKEKPVAYVYKQSERSNYRYVPLWDRFIDQINMSKVTELEAQVLSRRHGDGVRGSGRG